MKQQFFLRLLAFVITVTCLGQFTAFSQDEKLYSTELIQTPTYGNQSYTPSFSGGIVGGGSTERIMTGGTVFQITYATGIDIRLKAAFELACRLWEEALPSIPAIKIKVSTASLPMTPKPVLSDVRFLAYDLSYYCTASYKKPEVLFPLASAKAILYRNKYETTKLKPYYELEVFSYHPELLEEYDFEVVYNSNCMDLFAFNTDNNHTDANTTFDFTTVAIRDIGKGLGFTCDYQADNNTKKMYPLSRKPLYYESVLTDYLPYDYSTFIGSCEIPLMNMGHAPTSRITLATFDTWERGSSLCGFVTNNKIGLTKAMPRIITYGSYLRDFADGTMNAYVSNYLGWYTEEYSGMRSAGITDPDTMIEPVFIVPYMSDLSSIQNYLPESDSTNGATVYDSYATYYVSDIDSWISKYRPNPQSDKMVYLLRKDGTWLYTENLNGTGGLTIEDAIAAEGEDVFARDSQGHIRGGVASGKYNMTYCVFEARPEPIELEMISYTATGDNYRCSIGVKNAEGATNLRIVAKIKKVGTTTSYTEEYTVSNPNYRFFTITVPKNSNVTLTPYAINDNGETKGKDCSFFLYTPLPFEPVIKVQNRSIRFESISASDLASDLDSVSDEQYLYNIFRYDEFGTGVVASGYYTLGSAIDISNLSEGSYTLNYSIGQGEWKSFKFQN